MIQKYFIVIISILFSICIHSFSAVSDTIWNQTDKQGQKQGYWRVNYENGALKYVAFFKDNKPVGEMKRYYDNGAVKAIMLFYNNGTHSRSKIFYDNNNLAGEGNFIETRKDSTWKYYSFYDKSLRLEENYNNGVKTGVSKKYFPNGTVAEELNWTNDLKNGIWVQYFENGSVKLKSNYQYDKRSGEFLVYYDDGKIEMKGQFVNNLMQGEWIYYDAKGNEKTHISYINNVPQNASQLEKEQQEYFKMIEQNKGKIPEPDENSLMPPK